MSWETQTSRQVIGSETIGKRGLHHQMNGKTQPSDGKSASNEYIFIWVTMQSSEFMLLNRNWIASDRPDVNMNSDINAHALAFTSFQWIHTMRVYTQCMSLVMCLILAIHYQYRYQCTHPLIQILVIWPDLPRAAQQMLLIILTCMPNIFFDIRHQYHPYRGRRGLFVRQRSCDFQLFIFTTYNITNSIVCSSEMNIKMPTANAEHRFLPQNVQM